MPVSKVDLWTVAQSAVKIDETKIDTKQYQVAIIKFAIKYNEKK